MNCKYNVACSLCFEITLFILNVVVRLIVSALVSIICYYCSCLVNPTSELSIKHIIINIIIIFIIIIIIIIIIMALGASYTHSNFNAKFNIR